jgi:hypothetical protein
MLQSNPMRKLTEEFILKLVQLFSENQKWADVVV